MRAPQPLLDRSSLERLERLALRWQRSFAGLLGGQNVSRYPGVGHEFLDHRRFQQGDDLRSVNWRAYLRLDKLFLKMFRTEPRTPVRILLDVSESMACGASEPGARGEPKFHYAARLAAALCYVGLVRLETMVLQPFASDLGEGFHARGGRHRFARASQFLSGLETGGPSDFAAMVRRFSNAVHSPGLLIILSDFLDESDDCPAALQRLADQGHELYLVHIVDAEDVEPPWRGEIEAVDAETGTAVRLQMDDAAAGRVREAFEDHARDIERAALRNDGRYLRLETSTPLEEALFQSLTAAGAVTVQ